MAEQGHLLVVDDNKLNREMLSRRLARKGYEISEAESGVQALEMIEKQKYDLALFDVMMPGISGLEALEQVRKKYSAADFPVIMATAKTQSEDIVEALRLGANDYVTKPIDFPVLLARVQTHMSLKRLYKLKDEFLSIASHDLKNPLFVVVCHTYLLQQKVPTGAVMTEESFDLISKISHLARTMQNIIADFLDFQAAEDGHLKLTLAATDLNESAARIVLENSVYASEKDITVSFERDGDLPLVQADHNRIDQVIQNLLSNAIKFSPRGTQISVKSIRQGDSAGLEIRDSGPGLSSEDLERAFMKYGRLSNKPTGAEKSSGIGLAICKKMIDLHGGQVGVRNNPEGGATFWFTLPEHRPAEAAISSR